MRVLVCGGRDYDDWRQVVLALSNYNMDNKISLIISGGANGADFLGRVYAKYYDLPHQEFIADWRALGKKAGIVRNQQMIDIGKPDIVFAFPGGKGTADMVQRAEKAGIPVIKWKWKDET